jgi:serine phosphatase RsbU (regulator of sigma subunit)
VLLTLASTVAQSVQRATLYDREHSIAVGLQKSMLPAVIPSVAGTQIAVRYLPAHIGHRIGGDWYDVSRLPSGRISMTIGDVQGHDVQASAVMGQLRTTMRAYAAEGIAPATLAARASSFLLDLDTDLFATCLYAELDPLTGHVQIIRAGHHNPLIRHRDGATTRPDLQGGLPLGLLSRQDTPYPVNELDLEPADTLLLFTDGLVEFRDTDLDSGMRHLEALLHEDITDPERLADHLIRTLSRGPRQEDDIALLLVSRTGRK